MNPNLEIHTVTKSGKTKSAWFARSFEDLQGQSNERKHCESVAANGGMVLLMTSEVKPEAVTKMIEYLQAFNQTLIAKR